jgi:hypothetical protein
MIGRASDDWLPRRQAATRWLLAGALIALAGCSASSIDTSAPDHGEHAPANMRDSDGQVSYLNAGAKRVRNQRREDAYRKMHEHCGGDYEIVREEDQQGPIATQRMIWFRCLGATPAATPEP